MRPIVKRRRTPWLPEMEKLVRVWRLPFNLPNPNPRAPTQSKCPFSFSLFIGHACMLRSIRLADYSICICAIRWRLARDLICSKQLASRLSRSVYVRRCGAPSPPRLRCWPARSCACWRRRRWRRRRRGRRGGQRSASCRSEPRRTASPMTRRYYLELYSDEEEVSMDHAVSDSYS